MNMSTEPITESSTESITESSTFSAGASDIHSADTSAIPSADTSDIHSAATSDAPTIRSPLKAIRAFCVSCSGDSVYEVKRCPSFDCPLYAFRFGKNPYIKRTEMTEEQRGILAQRMENVRSARKKLDRNNGV